MGNHKTFKTKTGYCHITDTQIILTKRDVLGDFSKAGSPDKIAVILIVYVLLGVFLAYLSVSDFEQRKYSTALMYALVGAYLIYGVIKSRNNSATPVIERKSIQKVNFIQARTGATRACFEVIFKNQKGNLKTRLIFLPGSLSNGKAATDDALRIFKHENLID